MKVKLNLTKQQIKKMLENVEVGGVAEINIDINNVVQVSYKDIEIEVR